MSILPVLRMGDPVLRRASAEIVDPTDPTVVALSQAMIETMMDAPGVGLAAPQIGRNFRLIVMRIMSDRLMANHTGAATGQVRSIALVNPEWEPLGPETELGWEGCLSVPDLRGVVPRWSRIAYRGWTPDGARVEAEAEGFQARILQHEVDHLDGMLYIDRMTDFSTLGYSAEIMAAQASMEAVS